MHGHLTDQIKVQPHPVRSGKEACADRETLTHVVRKTLSGRPVGSGIRTRLELRTTVAEFFRKDRLFPKTLPWREQQQWVRGIGADDGPILCLFGPGTGKLGVLLGRLASLVESGTPATQIVVFTANDDASRQIVSRLDDSFPRRFAGMSSGTFAYMASIVLRRHGGRVGLKKGFSVLDEGDSVHLMAEVITENVASKGALLLPEAQVLWQICRDSANTLDPPEAVLMNRFPWHYWKKDTIIPLLEAYKEKKRAGNLLDTDDLVSRWYRLLVEQPKILEEQRKLWRHVIVDDYQESTRLQSLIAHELAGENGNLMVFADDMQVLGPGSGASVRNVRAFPSLYPKAAIVKLETTFRMTPEIADLANCVLDAGPKYFGETRLEVVREHGPKPKMVETDGHSDEARWVCEEIARLVGEGAAFRDMAVLYRSRFSSLEIQIELEQRGIPFGIRDDSEFFSHDHVRDVLAFVRASLGADKAAWERVLRLLPEIDKWTIKRVWNLVAQGTQDDITALLSEKGRKAWQALQRALTKLRALSGDPERTILSALEGEYGAYLQSGFPDYDPCIADVRRLARYARRFDDAAKLLDAVARFDAGGRRRQSGSGDPGNVVWLSSVMAVKGYEFNTVFVIGLADGEFFGSAALGRDDEENEDRRALYLAVTRARNGLYLLCPAEAPGSKDSLRSPRIEELDPGTYERVQARARESRVR